MLFHSLSAHFPLSTTYGVSLSRVALLAHIAAKKFNEGHFIKYSVYSITSLAVAVLIYQGILRDIRVYGNFGYANTYVLVLFIGLVCSEIYKAKKLDFYIKLVLITSLLFTGDRTITLLLIGWIIYSSLRHKGVHLVLCGMMGLIQYAVYTKLGIVSLLIAPLLVLLLHGLYKGGL